MSFFACCFAPQRQVDAGANRPPEKVKVAVPQLGVTLAFLDNFVEENGGVDAFAGWTTDDVWKKIVKAKTEKSKSSFCDVLYKEKAEGIRRADVVLTHSWRFSFLEVVSMLKTALEDKPHASVWIDVFSFSQYSVANVDYEFWLASLQKLLATADRCVFLAPLWTHPAPLPPLTSRWELYTTYFEIAHHKRLDLAISRLEKKRLIRDLVVDTAAKLVAFAAHVDVARSDFRDREIKQCLGDDLAAVEGGLDKVQATVAAWFKEQFVAIVEAELDETADEPFPPEDELDNDVDEDHNRSQRMDSIERMTSFDLATITEDLDEDAEDPEPEPPEERFEKNALRLTLAELLRSLGRFDRAETLLRDALADRLRRCGRVHPDTLTVLHLLGALHDEQAHYDVAEPLFAEAFKKRKAVLGPKHDDTIASMYALAVLYRNTKQFDAALPLYEKCYQLRRATLGDDHAQTLATQYNLALMYQNRKQFRLATPLYVDCLARRRQTLGETHPATLMVAYNLAVNYFSQGKFDLAEQSYLDCLDKRRRTLGDDHVDTLNALNNLAALYHQVGQVAPAALYYAECLERRTATLGAEHPATVRTRNNLEKLRAAQPAVVDAVLKPPVSEADEAAAAAAAAAATEEATATAATTGDEATDAAATAEATETTAAEAAAAATTTDDATTSTPSSSPKKKVSWFS
eukprot:gene1223-889_t